LIYVIFILVGRSYKRKTNKIDGDHLEQAILAVNNNQLKISRAAKDVGISRNTFKKYLRNEISSHNPTQGRYKNSFSLEQENELAEFCLTMSKR